MTNVNIDVKLEAISKGVKLCEIPAQMGISPSKFYDFMRVPLSDEKREEILNAISQLAVSR